MKALLSVRPGPPETLELTNVPDPAPKAGELRVRVRACAINYPDVLIIEDRYQFKPPRPFAPGGEVAGVVEALGEGVEGWRVGDRVVAMLGHGGLAERATVPAATAFRLPDGQAFEQGASLILTYGTVMHALVDRGRLQAGQTLLVLGAAGGVGLAAVEIGKALGARVVAAASSEEKAQAAREAGADKAIVYAADDVDPKALGAQFKAAVGAAGADVVLDPVGGDYAEPAIRALGWGGRYLVVGFPAGIPRPPLNLLLLKEADVLGVFWGAWAAREPAANRAHIEQLFRWWDEGRIAPRVSRTWPLAEGGAAIAHMAARRAVGKLVVTMDDAVAAG